MQANLRLGSERFSELPCSLTVVRGVNFYTPGGFVLNGPQDWGLGRSKCMGVFGALGRALVVRSVSGLALGEFPA